MVNKELESILEEDFILEFENIHLELKEDLNKSVVRKLDFNEGDIKDDLEVDLEFENDEDQDNLEDYAIAMGFAWINLDEEYEDHKKNSFKTDFEYEKEKETKSLGPFHWKILSENWHSFFQKLDLKKEAAIRIEFLARFIPDMTTPWNSNLLTIDNAENELEEPECKINNEILWFMDRRSK